MTLAEARKFLVAVAALAAQLLTLGLVPSPAAHYLSVVLAALGALGVYVVPNHRKPLPTSPGAPAAPVVAPPAPADPPQQAS